ncbi:hypothetical protein IPF37_01650 [bacterium]|nr:MAG: hypothetical protein IPF37_01650 [bacterium]
MVGLHSIKKLSLVTLVVSLFFCGAMHAAGTRRQTYREVKSLTPARAAQVYALLLRVPFFMAAQYHRAQNNSDAAVKNKVVARFC